VATDSVAESRLPAAPRLLAGFVAGSLRLLWQLCNPRNFSRLVLRSAAGEAWAYGFRVLPGFALIAVACGIGLGAGLFPMLQNFGVLGRSASLVYSITTFELAPLAAAGWYAIFSGPVLAMTGILRSQKGDGRALRDAGVPDEVITALPLWIGSFVAQFILSTTAAFLIFSGSLLAWTLILGAAPNPLIDWWAAAVDWRLVVLLPVKLLVFGCILSQLPLRTGALYPSMEKLTADGGFFSITVWTLGMITGVQLLWLILFRLS
jgi:hypothetical protein